MADKEETDIQPVNVKKSFDILFGNTENRIDNIQKTAKEQTLEKALEELFSTDNIDLKSDINNQQISAISRGYIFAEVYHCKYMGDLVRHILELSVSKNREGRKEFVKVLQAVNPEAEEEMPLKLMRRRLLE